MTEKAATQKAVTPPSPSVSEAGDLIDLPDGKGLQLDAAKSIARRSPTSVVLIAGNSESGKTTIFKAIYLLFQHKPYADLFFSGSATLCGLEERSYDSRIVSGRTTPATERTKPKREMLHLQVRQRDCLAKARDLLFHDIRGEEFEEARDSEETCGELTLIRDASFFVLLFDGERLAAPTTRQKARRDPLMLLRRCIGAGMLGKRSRVHVLFTKWDMVEVHADKPAIESVIREVEQLLTSEFEAKLASLRYGRIAAEPKQRPTWQLGYGLEPFFLEWLQDLGEPQTEVRPAAPFLVSQYDKYAIARD